MPLTKKRFERSRMTRTELLPGKYSESLYPQPEMLARRPEKRKLRIGLPKEPGAHEYRIMLNPSAVKQLTEDGHTILLEAGAGGRSNWSDVEFSNAGAIISERNEVFKCDVVLKVSPLSSEEIGLLVGNQTVFSALHSNTQTTENIRKLMQKRVTAVAYELVKDQYGYFPFVHSMSEISGMLAVTTAGEYLSRNNGRGIVMGGITGVPPAKVMILGSGTAAEYAARAAVGLGALVKIFDDSVSRLNSLKNKLGTGVYTYFSQKNSLTSNLKTADVLIGALDFTGKIPRMNITEEMVAGMKPGSVIVDLNTDNVSCIETSHITDLGNPTFEKFNVLHYCVPNIASRAPRTASIAMSNAILPILDLFSEETITRRIMRNETCIRNGTYIYEGILTNAYLGRIFNLDYKDIDLLTAIF